MEPNEAKDLQELAEDVEKADKKRENALRPVARRESSSPNANLSSCITFLPQAPVNAHGLP